MIEKNRLLALKNVAGGWLGFGTSVIVNFLLTPFVLRHVGDASNGIWILLTTFTGYYGLLDFGMRPATTRYISRYHAMDDNAQVNRVVSTAFFFQLGIGLVMLLATGIVYLLFDPLFNVGPEWRETGRLLLLVVGIGTAVTTPLAFFSNVIEGFQRFAVNGWIQMVNALVRAGLLVFFLSRGYGILAVAGITVMMNFLSAFTVMVLAFRLAPQVSIRPSYAGWDTFRELRSFGVIGFLIAVAQPIRFQMDSLVIAKMLTIESVTMFSNGARLSIYSIDILQMMVQIFTPMASAAQATGEHDRQRRLFIMSNRYSGFVALPLGAIFLIMGQTILRAWVGEKYVEIGYAVLAILTVPMTIHLMQAGSPKMLLGMARHKTLAIVLLIEALANLILSIALVPHYGLLGVAWGTAIPLLASNLFFLPLHVCSLLKVRIWDFLVEAYSYPLVAVIPFALALRAADQWIQAKHFSGVVATLALGGVVYVAELALYYLLVERRARQEA